MVGLASQFVGTAAVLMAVCGALLWALRVLRASGGQKEGPLQVHARLELELKRSLYLVEAHGRILLLGVGEGPITVLAELGSRASEVAEPGYASKDAARLAGKQALALEPR